VLFSFWAVQAQSTHIVSTNDDVRLRVSVVDSVKRYDFNGPLTSITDDGRKFALILRIDSCIPAITNLKAGTFVSFCVDNPRLFLGASAARGGTHEISISRKLAARLLVSDTEAHARKYEYYEIHPGAPEIGVELTFPDAISAEWYRHEDAIQADRKVFTDIVRQFATTNGMESFPNPRGEIYMGPPLCSFKNARLEIKMEGRQCLDDCGMFSIASRTPHLSPDLFKAETDPLLDALRSRFPNRLKIERKVWFDAQAQGTAE
jgi:hypothetical protein